MTDTQEIPIIQGNIARLLYTNITNQVQDTIAAIRTGWETHGDLHGFKIAGMTLLFASHPDLAQEILINQRDIFKKPTATDENGDPLSPVLGNGLVTNPDTDHWRGQRRMVQPMFHRRKIATMADKMTAAGNRMLDRWQTDFEDGATVEIDHEMMLTTMDIITQTMFSTDIMDSADDIGETVNTSLELSFKLRTINNVLPAWIPLPDRAKLKSATAQLDQDIQRIIDERRNDPQKDDYDDLLAMLLDARDEETGAPMPPAQLLDEVKTIFGAGHETTSHALTWTLHLLSQHPETQEQLHDEIMRIVGDRTPTMDDLPALKLTEMVLNESLRMYPPASVTARTAIQPTTLGGYEIPQNQRVIISIYNIHHHPDLWDDPDQFRPSRFETDGWKQTHRLAFMPFGAGQRLCVGNHFAMMEAQLLLAQMLQKYRFKPVAGHEAEMELAVTLRPRDGLPLILEQRN